MSSTNQRISGDLQLTVAHAEFAITDGGVQALTPYPVDEIIVAS